MLGCWGVGVLGCWVLGCWVLGVGCWAIAPEKIEHRLNGRKYIVQLAKDPPPLLHQKSGGPSLRYLLHYSKMDFVLERNEFHTAFTCKII